MAYTHTNSKGQKYILHQKDAQLKGRIQRIYFFAKAISEKGTPIDAVPAGRIVVENANTGLPVLKKG
jgi:hypothetical protein